MQQSKSKLAAGVLIAALALGAPALAKSLRGARPFATHTDQAAKNGRDRMPEVIGSTGQMPEVIGSTRRSPTFGAPNPNSPALLTGGGSTGYNANLYVY